MFFLFSPLTFYLLSAYFLLLLSIISLIDFYYFWIYIEFLMLLFMGLGFSLMSNSFVYLLLYFLIQTLASFIIFLSFIYNFYLIFTISLVFNMGMFPFIFWFINILYRFPVFLFFLSSTFHNLPVLFLIYNFSIVLNFQLLWTSFILSVLLSGLSILNVKDLRFLLLYSSIATSCWLILAVYISIFTLLLFFTFYFFSLFLVLLGSYSSNHVNLNHSNNKVLKFTLSLVSLSGFPPFPLFFSNVYIILAYFLMVSPIYLFIYLFSSALVMVSYIYFLFQYYLFVYNIEV